MFRRTLALAAIAAAAAASCGMAIAQTAAPAAPVMAEGAWARASVPGQKATGAFMKLTAQKPLRLVSASSPAGTAEVHEMKMEGDVMRMRAVDGLDLPAGKPVELKPGGYHVMLQDLKAPLAAGAKVPLTLTFTDASGQKSQLLLEVPVQLSAPGAPAGASTGAMPMNMPMGDHKH